MASKKIGKEVTTETRRRARTILAGLKREFPMAATALRHSSALELLVATILSAQCTDVRVNKVTPELFRRYRSAADFAGAEPAELELMIKSTGFFRTKSRSIINCCKMLLVRFRGEVPSTLSELVQLPGVGRKTANVVLGSFFGRAEGIVVDTHVKRLSQRLGFSRQLDPEKIEEDLMTLFPGKDWIDVGSLLILHGRTTCKARKPQCPACGINRWCPSSEA